MTDNYQLLIDQTLAQARVFIVENEVYYNQTRVKRLHCHAIDGQSTKELDDTRLHVQVQDNVITAIDYAS